MITAPKRKTARHAMLREERAVLDRFFAECRKLGIAADEAIRQLVRAQLRNPQAFSKLTQSIRLGARLSGARDDAETVAAFKADAARQGLTSSELMRQLIRAYLRSTQTQQENS